MLLLHCVKVIFKRKWKQRINRSEMTYFSLTYLRHNFKFSTLDSKILQKTTLNPLPLACDQMVTDLKLHRDNALRDLSPKRV